MTPLVGLRPRRQPVIHRVPSLTGRNPHLTLTKRANFPAQERLFQNLQTTG